MVAPAKRVVALSAAEAGDTYGSDVVSAVSGAIRSGAKAIDGEIWRGGRRIPFVVEIPRRKKKKPRP